jgi:hypothetical protein
LKRSERKKRKRGIIRRRRRGWSTPNSTICGMPLQVSMVHGGGGGEEVGEVFLLSS